MPNPFELAEFPESLASEKQDLLVEEAWRLEADALHSGQITLKGKDGRPGKTIVFDGKDMLRHIHWLAAAKRQKAKSIPKIKDAFLKPTT